MMVRPQSTPRISPGGRADIGRVTWVLLTVASRRLGGPVPNVMLTLARARGLFLPWLWFASRLMPNGTLPPAEAELVILRVGALCGSAYERHHHTSLGKQAGLGDAVIAWSAQDDAASTPAPQGNGIDPERASLLVRACDELLQTHTMAQELWAQLSQHYGEPQLLELSMLIGQYAMLAGTLNAAGVQIEPTRSMHRLR